MDNFKKKLKEYFGYDDFREGQEYIIEQIIAGNDICAIMPTGAGKSICYQLPALCRDGYTLVISPLIALMKDQVDALRQKNIPAAYLNSHLSLSEQNEVIAAVYRQEIKLLYISPERFRVENMRQLLHNIPPVSLVVDEAHCISQWGHDFRPDYARIGVYCQNYEIKQVCAFTATATPVVREDIKKQLSKPNMEIFVTGFARSNLSFQVAIPPKSKNSKRTKLQEILKDEKSTLIYCSTRKVVEELMEILQIRGYHAGMTPQDRNDAQEYFLTNPNPMMAATNAFGMGIDRGDIRRVIHYNFPGSLESYYQEAGRAGRDRKDAECIIIYSYQDWYIHDFFIKSSNPEQETIISVWDFLRRIYTPDENIEMTMEQITKRVPQAVSDRQISSILSILEKSGYISREMRGNVPGTLSFRLSVEDSINLYADEKNQRAIFMHRCAKSLGEKLKDGMLITISQLEQITSLKNEQIQRVLRALNEDIIDWQAPFSGRAIRVEKPLEEKLTIDFKELQVKMDIDVQRLNTVIAYINTPKCRQATILDYFGEEHDNWRCGNCDLCQKGQVTITEKDKTTAKIILKAVKSLPFNIGKMKLAQWLRGSQSKQITQTNLHQRPYHGELENFSQNKVLDLVQLLINEGFFSIKTGNYPVIEITESGTQILKNPTNFLQQETTTTGDGQNAGTIAAQARVEELENTLRQLRNNMAKELNLQPFNICNNNTLKAIALQQPSTVTEIDQIAKAKNTFWYESFLATIKHQPKS